MRRDEAARQPTQKPITAVILCVLTALWVLFCLSTARAQPQLLAVDAPLTDQIETEEGKAIPEGQKLIAITFDDGPKRSTTTRLLDGLSERGVQATFFLIGSQIEGNEDLVRRMDEEGHQIGIHTFDHVQLTALSRADFDAQVERSRALLEQVLGHNDLLLRPPYGLLDATVKQWAGCPIILWSIDPEDWSDRDAERVADHIVEHAGDGEIILLHDIYPESVDAALEAIDRLHDEGYYFVTVSELFAANHIALEPGEVYRKVPE
ncbi:MAG: polysaccharide deacetylase family protein [Oscillospiraceae bacterium]|nr:polysaccharide deacetylase family protein [Oscillospiraceae bacterium]